MDLSTSPFPIEWLEDETLHSICVRHVLLGGRATLKETVKALLHNDAGTINCHFQGNLDAFVARTKGLLGNHEDIIHKHTVVPNYLSFMSESVANGVVDELRGPRLSMSGTAPLSAAHQRYPKQLHLRLCTQCVAGDEMIRGFAHWRRAHQLPGAYRCLKHDSALLQLSVNPSADGSIVEMPRSDRVFLDRLTVAVPRQVGERETAIHAITQVAVDLSELALSTRFEPEAVNRAYRAKLNESLMQDGRSLRRHANAELVRFAGGLDALPDAPQWLSSSVLRGELISRVLFPRSSFSRPLLHAIFIAWLFGSLKEFESMYAIQCAPAQPAIGATPARKRPVRSDAGTLYDEKARVMALRKAQFQVLLSEGLTASEAGRRMGMEAGTGRRWAAVLGLGKRRKDATLSFEVRGELERSLRAGTGREKIARTLGISVNAVRMFCHLHPEVEGARQQLRQTQRERDLSAARESWLEALRRSRRGDRAATLVVVNDGKFFKMYDPAGYESMLALHPVKNHLSRKLPGLTEMDGQLAAAVDEAASALRAENPGRPIHTWDIVRVLESRGLLNMDCERLLLPLARAALKRVLKQFRIPKPSTRRVVSLVAVPTK